MRQENRSSPQCVALSPQVAAMLFQKTKKHKKIKPWAVSSKNRRTCKIDARKIKLLSQNFARNYLFSRDASESSRKDSLCAAREDSSARESPQESCFFARALFNFARSGKRLRARLLELCAIYNPFSRRLSKFRARSYDSKFIFLASILRILWFCC